MSEHQELAELEMAFAKDPTRFVALTAAYLQHGRFMEAMVVCKKGIKSQPDSVEGRLLLARVYAEQGKVPKAVDELKGLLEQHPESAEGHFFFGQMLEKSGKFEEAIESFKEALRKDRGHAGATAALKAKGIDWSPGPSPEEIAAAEAARQAAEEAQRRAEEARLAEEAARAQQAQQQAQAQARASQPPRASSGNGSSGAVSRPPMAAFPNDPMYQSAAGMYGWASGPVPVQSAGRRLGPGFTFGLGALLLLVVVGVIVGLKLRHDHQALIAEHYHAAVRAIATDTTKGHKDGVRELEEALKVDDGEKRVVAKYALSMAILAFERGEKDLDDKAKAAVARAAKVGPHQHETIAAEMIVDRVEGKADAAVALAKTVEPDPLKLPVDVRVELGRADAALGNVPDMLKIADSLKDLPDAMGLTFAGDAYRRAGEHARARIALDNAIKNDLDHDPARALRALVILEDDDITNLNVAIDDVKSVKDLGKDAVGPKQLGYASLGLGIIGKKIGRPDRDVEADLQKARQILGGDPEVPLFDAKQAVDSDPQKAIQFAEQAIKADRVRLAPYLVIVEAAIRAKSFSRADKALADATAVFGDNLELGLAKATRLSAEGRNDEAIAALKAMLVGHDVAEVYRDIGKVYLRMDKYTEAVDWLKKAADKAKTRAPAVQANVYLTLGKAYAKAGDHENAAAIYAQALGATAEYTETYFFMALSMQALHKDGAAKEACVKYLRADPNGKYAQPCRGIAQ